MDRLRPDAAEEYDRYLLRHDGSLFYYCSRYKDFLKALLGCREEYLVAREGAEIRGVLPLMFAEAGGARVYNSLPFYGSNGGALADGPEANDALVAAYNEIALRPDTVSATVVGNPFAPQDASRLRHSHTDHRTGQFTDIRFRENPWEEILARVDSSARRNVQKAAREGVTVERDASALDRLREMHRDNIEAIGGRAKRREFFDMIPRHFREGADFDLYVARKDGRVVAGLLLFYFNRTVEYITPATDHEYRSLQPLSLILITAMSDAARRGFACWNWGGTWESQIGVYRFKRKWAADERPYHYHTQLNDPSVLEMGPDEIAARYPHFFVVPFSALKSPAGAGA